MDSHMLEMASKNKLSKVFRWGYKHFFTPMLIKDKIPVIRTQDDRYAFVMVGLSDEQRQQIPKVLDMLRKDPEKWKMKTGAAKEIIQDADGCVAIPTDIRVMYQEITGEDYVPGREKKSAVTLFLGKTNSPRELAEIYTAADVFANATYEDTYPTVNLEARACGLRVVTYAVCGIPETI